MAKIIHPHSSLIPVFDSDEISTLLHLQQTLPDDYTVFHSVNWMKRFSSKTTYGEADFVIVGPNSSVILIEQKNGVLFDDDGRLKKKYQDGKLCDPFSQITRCRENMATLWLRKNKHNPIHCEILIFLPDFSIDTTIAHKNDLNLIIDQINKENLANKIIKCSERNSNSKVNHNLLINFFTDDLSLRLDIGAILKQQNGIFDQIVSRQSEYLHQLSFSPFNLAITGAAGTGKTQLAFEFLLRAIEKDKRALYLCFNRLLADKLKKINNEINIYSIDHLTNICMQDHAIYDIKEEDKSDVFQRLRSLAKSEALNEKWQFDIIVIDEGQDITQEQFEFIQLLGKQDCQFIFCSDPRQNIYNNDFQFNATVTLSLEKQFRSEKQIINLTNILCKDQAISQFQGIDLQNEMSQVLSYTSFSDQCGLIKSTINQWLAEGYNLRDIQIITCRGRSKSELLTLDQIGPFILKSFTGEYDNENNQLYSPGDLNIETVYRFKGNQSSCVIVTEFDIEQYNSKQQKLLYTALTRAKLKVALLMSKSSEKAIAEYLQPSG